MIAGIVTIAVGDELVITHPLGHPNPAWLPVILGGPALFLAGRAIFEYAVFGRVSRPRVIGALALVAITPAMALVPPLAVATTAAFILAVSPPSFCSVSPHPTWPALEDAQPSRRHHPVRRSRAGRRSASRCSDRLGSL